MRIFQKLLYCCFLLVFLGGTGTVAGLITRSNALRLPFMWVLCIGLGLFVVSLAGALLIGGYLYFFTDRKSLTYFSREK